MGILKKFKLWWKSTTSAEKVCIILSGISTAAAVTGAVCSVKTRHCMEDVKIDVKLYPGGKDDPNPVNLTPDEPRPMVFTSPEDVITCAPAASPMMKADTESEKWEVWNPEWEPLQKSASGYESVRLADALEVLLRTEDDGSLNMNNAEEAEMRVEDLARQFAYLEGSEDEFRTRFPQLKDHVGDIYENVAGEGE